MNALAGSSDSGRDDRGLESKDGTIRARREFLAAAATATFAAACTSTAQAQPPTPIPVGKAPATPRPTAARATQFVQGCNLKFSRDLPVESERANEAFAKYLLDNTRRSETLHKLSSRLRVFIDAAPRVFISKCIDGRVHTSDDLGFPPTTVTFIRTEGTNVDLTATNSIFWNRLHGVILDASRHTPGCPALFLALGHYAKIGSGCAAHHEDDEKALETVALQAEFLRKRYPTSLLYVLHGMSNTDDRSTRLIFPDGHELSSALIIRRLDTKESPLRSPTDVFQKEFLDELFDDRETSLHVGGRAPRPLMLGDEAPMFHDLEVMIALEAYLASEMWHVVHRRSRNNVVFHPRVIEEILHVLDAVKDLPRELRAPLAYLTAWNVAYTLHERQRLEGLNDTQRQLELSHAEHLVAYGEGFEVEPRNSLVLVKPGRGNDQDALKVARVVITTNRHRRGEQRHPPLVHINVEVSGALDSWQAFSDNVLSKLLTMTTNVHTVFDDDCRVLTTYSYRDQKRFYPVRVDADPTAPGAEPRECYPSDVAFGLTSDDFSPNEIRLREDAYTRSVLS